MASLPLFVASTTSRVVNATKTGRASRGEGVA